MFLIYEQDPERRARVLGLVLVALLLLLKNWALRYLMRSLFFTTTFLLIFTDAAPFCCLARVARPSADP